MPGWERNAGKCILSIAWASEGDAEPLLVRFFAVDEGEGLIPHFGVNPTFHTDMDEIAKHPEIFDMVLTDCPGKYRESRMCDGKSPKCPQDRRPLLTFWITRISLCVCLGLQAAITLLR
jgi:hypothetical protein